MISTRTVYIEHFFTEPFKIFNEVMFGVILDLDMCMKLRDVYTTTDPVMVLL